MDQPALKIVKEVAEEFFQKMTFNVEIESISQKEQTLAVAIKTDEPQLLIGQGGETLFEIQHLLKAMLRRKIEEIFYIDLDINDYKSKKIEYLKELARSIADDVALTKKERTLSPMSAYERRIIHLELADRSDVITESVGQEPERMVVVKPRA